MAIKEWTGGAADGNFGTAGNWLGGVAPIAADDIVLAVTNGTHPDIDAGLTTGLSLGNATVTPGFSGKIGSEAAALSVALTGTFTYAGTGEYCKMTGNVVNSNVQHANGKLIVSGGTWGTAGVHNIAGRTIIEAAAVMAGTWNVVGGTTLEVAANATAIPSLNAVGGVFIEITGRDVTASNQDGGMWTIIGDGQFAAHVIQKGTTRLWNTGTNAAITNKAGLLTVAGSQAASSPIITLYTPWSFAREVLVFNHISVTPGTTVPVGARLGLGSAAVV